MKRRTVPRLLAIALMVLIGIVWWETGTAPDRLTFSDAAVPLLSLALVLVGAVAIFGTRQAAGEIRLRLAAEKALRETQVATEERIARRTAELSAAYAEMGMAHEGLQASEERFRTLCASAPIGIFFTDAAGSTLYTNAHWSHLAGLSLGESVGDGWQRAVHPEDAPATLADWRCAVREGGEFDAEFRFCTPTGEVRWVHARSIPIRQATGVITGHVGTTENITGRKAAEAALVKTQEKLIETSRRAGMAEVATAVLHNVGNVLNSVNVASACVAASLRKSKAATLERVVAILRENEGDLASFFTNDSRGRQLPDFLARLAERLAGERISALEELGHLQKGIEHIKDIVGMQQDYAKVSGAAETVRVVDLLEDTVRMNKECLAKHAIRIVREFSDVPPVAVEKHKVLQILVNLVRNAQQACDASGRQDKTLTLRVFNGAGKVKVAVADNGVGISPENLERVFSHGFTTKKDGHGFGLHSGALAARELGGSLWVESDGCDRGTTFTLELPIDRAAHSAVT